MGGWLAAFYKFICLQARPFFFAYIATRYMARLCNTLILVTVIPPIGSDDFVAIQSKHGLRTRPYSFLGLVHWRYHQRLLGFSPVRFKKKYDWQSSSYQVPRIPVEKNNTLQVNHHRQTVIKIRLKFFLGGLLCVTLPTHIVVCGCI